MAFAESGESKGARPEWEMARGKWNVAGNGQFGRLAKSAGVRRNPHEYAGTGAIRQKKPQPHGLGFCDWWSWRELNPRPQALFGQIYMFSVLF